MNQITFRNAQIKDVPNLMQICKKVVKHMISNGILQWDNSYPNSEVFKNDIKKNELYLLENTDNNDIIGFICINKQVYPAYDEVTWEENENFKVLHRVAINPKYHSQGYGIKLYTLAQEEVKKQNINYIRVDTFSENIPMNNLIKKLNYKFLGTMNYKEGKPPWNCYEKKID